jgi:hypothetical protein
MEEIMAELTANNLVALAAKLPLYGCFLSGDVLIKRCEQNSDHTFVTGETNWDKRLWPFVEEQLRQVAARAWVKEARRPGRYSTTAVFPLPKAEVEEAANELSRLHDIHRSMALPFLKGFDEPVAGSGWFYQRPDRKTALFVRAEDVEPGRSRLPPAIASSKAWARRKLDWAENRDGYFDEVYEQILDPKGIHPGFPTLKGLFDGSSLTKVGGVVLQMEGDRIVRAWASFDDLPRYGGFAYRASDTKIQAAA